MAEKKEVTKAEKKQPVKAKKDKVPFGQKVKKFFRDYGSELKKITWSPFKDVKKNGALVIGAMVVFGAALAVIDWLFSWGVELLGRIA